MTIKAKHFTPDTLLSLPRRDSGVPNHDATRILYSVSTYDFEKHEQKSELRVFVTETRESYLLDDNKESSNPVWLEGEAEKRDGLIALLRGEEKGRTSLLIGPVDGFKEK